MGKIFETAIKKWDGGMQTDSRREGVGGRLFKNFDILSFPSKLKPYNSSESGNDTSAREIASFLYANSRVYGFGVQTGTSRSQIFYKDTFTDGSWSETGNNQSGAVARNTGLFVYYKGYIFLGAASRVSKYDADGGDAWVETDLSVSYTNIAQGLVHSKDDNLYVGIDNKIYRKTDAATWDNGSAAVLTLPDDYFVTSLSEYGNYLAIACAPLATKGRPVSRVFLWDRDSSLTTLSESIDWGGGNLNVLEEYDGGLLGISELGNRLIIKYWSGGFLKIGERKHLEFLMDVNTSITLSKQKQKVNDRVYFMMSCTIDGTVHYGVWTVGKNSDGMFALSLDRTPNNDTAPNSIQGFQLATVSGVDYMFVAYTDSNADEQVSKTSETSTVYLHTSTAQSQIFNVTKACETKKLVRVKVSTEPFKVQHTLSSYTVAYRKDQETSYTTIFTSGLVTAGSFVIGNTYTILVVGSTDFTAIGASANTVGVTFTATGAGTGSGQAGDLITHAAINIESSGATLPIFNEIQFQITLTGGVVITEFYFESEVIERAI